MKILKLLNKKYFSIILVLLLIVPSYAEEQPVDIWNIDKKKIEEESLKDNTENFKEEIEIKDNSDSNIYDMQSQKEVSVINLEEKLDTKEIKIIGLYDPEEYGLDINMWSTSDGEQLKKLFNKLNKMNLSNDAAEIMNISVLTNAYQPQKNISEKEFLKFKSDWLIKNADLNLIEEYIIKNQLFDIQPELTKYLVDYYLSDSMGIVGSTYDPTLNIFKEPVPTDIVGAACTSWTLNTTTGKYTPPIAYPGITTAQDDAGLIYYWKEADYQADNNTGWGLTTK